ncbi:hypothetical protein P692DRAFT_201857503 [Suillus brevipes Sb2]|nr:hypothetical protein P692DRAFT_201857503 [Suillus brevipes Sb2]
MSAAALAGRPVSSFIADNFNRGEKTQNIDDNLAGPESISLDDIDAAFALLECEKNAIERELVDGNEVLEGQVYDFAALEHVDQGLAPKSVDDEIMVVEHTSHNDGQWDVNRLENFAKRQKWWFCHFCRLCRHKCPQTILPPALAVDTVLSRVTNLADVTYVTSTCLLTALKAEENEAQPENAANMIQLDP